MEDLLHVVESVTFEPPARYRQVPKPVLTGFHVAQVDQPIGCELRVQHHVTQSRLLAAILRHCAATEREDRRQSADGGFEKHPLAHDAKPAGPLGDQHVALWGERHGMRMHETVHKRLDPEIVMRRPHDGSRWRLLASDAVRTEADEQRRSRDNTEHVRSHMWEHDSFETGTNQRASCSVAEHGTRLVDAGRSKARRERVWKRSSTGQLSIYPAMWEKSERRPLGNRSNDYASLKLPDT